MCSELLPKEFEKATEVLPFPKYGVSTIGDFQKAENDVQHLEWLKKVGLTDEEIKLYKANESGAIGQCQKIESSALKSRLDNIYKKVQEFKNKAGSSLQCPEERVAKNADTIFEKIHKKTLKFYPEGHPMNELKEIEESLFGHLKNDNIIPLTKRRKIIRRFERKKERILSQSKLLDVGRIDYCTVNRPGSLWDQKEMPVRLRPQDTEKKVERIIGPKKQTMYTIKDNKIVRLEPIQKDGGVPNDEYRAVDIVMPVNAAEEQLLEGTKMSVDDIKKIDRFKDYEPGIPSKILYLKNIALSVTQEQLSVLFNQFVLENGGPIDVRLMTGGRMRGQAFVSFQNEDLAIQALEEINGTIVSGQPIIAQFGRNTNRIQEEEDS